MPNKITLKLNCPVTLNIPNLDNVPIDRELQNKMDRIKLYGNSVNRPITELLYNDNGWWEFVQYCKYDKTIYDIDLDKVYQDMGGVYDTSCVFRLKRLVYSIGICAKFAFQFVINKIVALWTK